MFADDETLRRKVQSMTDCYIDPPPPPPPSLSSAPSSPTPQVNSLTHHSPSASTLHITTDQLISAEPSGSERAVKRPSSP